MGKILCCMVVSSSKCKPSHVCFLYINLELNVCHSCWSCSKAKVVPRQLVHTARVYIQFSRQAVILSSPYPHPPLTPSRLMHRNFVRFPWKIWLVIDIHSLGWRALALCTVSEVPFPRIQHNKLRQCLDSRLAPLTLCITVNQISALKSYISIFGL